MTELIWATILATMLRIAKRIQLFSLVAVMALAWLGAAMLLPQASFSQVAELNAGLPHSSGALAAGTMPGHGGGERAKQLISKRPNTTQDAVSPLLDALFFQAQKVAADPWGDPSIIPTYSNENCFEFLRALYSLAGFDLQQIVNSSFEVENVIRDGDLVKIESSTFRGLPHWGLFYKGQVYHNWGGFRLDKWTDFLEYYPAEGSAVRIFRPSFPGEPANQASITAQSEAPSN